MEMVGEYFQQYLRIIRFQISGRIIWQDCHIPDIRQKFIFDRMISSCRISDPTLVTTRIYQWFIVEPRGQHKQSVASYTIWAKKKLTVQRLKKHKTNWIIPNYFITKPSSKLRGIPMCFKNHTRLSNISLLCHINEDQIWHMWGANTSGKIVN